MHYTTPDQQAPIPLPLEHQHGTCWFFIGTAHWALRIGNCPVMVQIWAESGTVLEPQYGPELGQFWNRISLVRRDLSILFSGGHPLLWKFFSFPLDSRASYPIN